MHHSDGPRRLVNERENTVPMDPDPPVQPGHGQGASSVSSQSPLYGSQASSKTKAAGKPRLRFAEEQRASWPRSWHSKSDKGEKKEKSEKSRGPPGVYWSDDAEANESQYTFYRESTPTPPEYDEERERAIQYSRAIGMMGHGRSSQGTIPSFDAPPLHPFGSRVCGMRKGLFWAIVIITGVLLIAVGIGTGVGIGLAKNSAHSSSSTSPPNATTPGSPSSSETSTQPTSAASSAAPAASASTAVCQLSTNNTIYRVPNSSKTFKRYCGIDFGGVGGATDITSVLTSTMEECMFSCSGLASCQGCGWGVLAKDEGPKYRCWLKTDLQTAHNATLDWSFAILQ